MASSPPGVDMMRSWMLQTDCRPVGLHREPDDGEAVRDPIGAVERWPGRWFSEESMYLCWLLCISFRSEPQRRHERKWRTRGEREEWKWQRHVRRENEREGTKRRKDQCKTHSTQYRIKTNAVIQRWGRGSSGFHTSLFMCNVFRTGETNCDLLPLYLVRSASLITNLITLNKNLLLLDPL